MAFLSRKEIERIGFKRVGGDVLISGKTSIYNPSNIEIGSNVRIDDFCVLSAGEGGISIGCNVHIAVFTSLIGAGLIKLEDFSNLSSRVSIYSSNDDYSGLTLTNPTVPSTLRNVKVADVYIGKHVIIGAGSVILPGVTISTGAAIGALSLVNEDCKEFEIYAGRPAKYIKKRKNNLLFLESKLNDFL